MHFLPFIFCIPLVFGAPAKEEALNKILIEENPDTAGNREKIRGIINKAFANRIPRVQGRQGVAPPVKLVSMSCWRMYQ